MKKSNTYLLLSAICLAFYLIIEFTSIYGNPGWFKFFLLLLGFTFLISGIGGKKKRPKK